MIGDFFVSDQGQRPHTQTIARIINFLVRFAGEHIEVSRRHRRKRLSPILQYNGVPKGDGTVEEITSLIILDSSGSTRGTLLAVVLANALIANGIVDYEMGRVVCTTVAFTLTDFRILPDGPALSTNPVVALIDVCSGLFTA